MDKPDSKIIVIVGPTASGKSDLAIKLAIKLKGEIISADSRQVYRGFDLTSGKVSKKERKLVPHHMLDIVSAKQTFNVALYRDRARNILNKILKKGKIPIIVGGTGFYIDALLDRIILPAVKPNRILRAKLAKQSSEQLFSKLSAIDPKRTKSIDRHNKVRLIRALEIALSDVGAKKLLSTYHPPRSNLIWLGLNPGNEILDKNIKKRLKQRFKKGLVAEINKGGLSHRRLESLGLEFRWISRFLRDLITKKEMEQELYKDIVRYSKRQMTWFKRNKEIIWFSTISKAYRHTLLALKK